MAHITDYKNVWAETLRDLDEEVQAAIDEGWQPYDRPDFHTNSFCQTMVKTESTIDNSTLEELATSIQKLAYEMQFLKH